MRFPAPIAVPLLALGLACAAGQASRAATLSVAVNHSLRLPVAGRAASVVVGNAAVADVTVVDSRTLFVTGKTAGSTDLAVVDPLGRTVFAADIAVVAGTGRPVTIHRATDTAELRCDPRCLAPTAVTAPGGAPAGTAGAAPLGLGGLGGLGGMAAATLGGVASAAAPLAPVT